MKTKLILASKSPRRSELLKTIYPYPFLIIPSDIDESLIKEENIIKRIEMIGRAKLERIKNLYPNNPIIASDTMISLDEVNPIGKPRNRDDAILMLESISGKIHKVYTSYSFYDGKSKEFTGITMAEVKIPHMSKDEIIDYIDKYHPLDKAGSYGIQDEGLKVELISGRKDIVMGFPTEEIKELLIKASLL